MNSGFPLVMLVGPLIGAALALAFRQWRRAVAAIGLVTISVLGILLLLAAPGEGVFADNTLGFFGRELTLTATVRGLFLFLYPVLGGIFLMSWFRPIGRGLVPVGLAILSPLAAAVMIAPPGIGAVLLAVAAAVAVPAVQGRRFAAAAAAWRYFLFFALALAPMLLVASTPSIAGAPPISLWLSALLAGIILLGAFPVHLWIVAVNRHTSPAAVALVLGVFQAVAVIYLVGLLDTVPAARAASEFQTAVRWSAALTALLAAFRLGRAMEWREVMSGVILLDSGFLLIALLAPGVDGLMLALPALIARSLGLTLVTLGMVLPQATLRSNAYGAARPSQLLRPALLFYGYVSLLGMPLTPGFAGRWAQVGLAARGGSFGPVLLLLLALACAAVFLFRAAQYVNTGNPGDISISRGEMIFGLAMLGLALLLGLFPDLLLGYVSRVLGVF